MKPYRFSFDVDISNSLIVVTYSGQSEGADLCQSMVDHMQGFRNAWRYDCIFDVRNYIDTFSDDDNAEIERAWFELTKGRDVGRRSAIIGSDPALPARMGTFQAAFPYRKFAFFDNIEAAMEWINGLSDPDTGEAQFV